MNYLFGIFRFVKELFRFNIINPKAKFGKNVRLDHFIIIEHDVEIGDHSWIGSYTYIRPGTTIGHHSEVRLQSFIAGHGVKIGNYTKVCQQATIGQSIQIGNRCFLAPGISTANTKHIQHQRKIENYKVDLPVIEDNVRIGANVTILPGVRIAKDSYIGGGSVVVKDTEPYGVYVGNPARKIKEVPKDHRVGE